MANHGVVIANKLAAKDIDAYVRPVVSASNVDNGFVFNLLAKSSTTGEAEVWTATWPVTGSLTGLWMALEPAVPSVFGAVTTRQYRGLGTVQDFYNVAGQIFTAVKLVAGDILTMTAESVGSQTVNDYANATTGTYYMVFGAAGASSAAIWKRLATTYISIPDGSIASQHVTAYQFEVLIA